MNHFDGIESFEEFDWFPETDTADDYESIVDLKNKAENENTYEETDLEIKGRHDVCLCPRIVPVVEAMTSIVLADMLLRNKSATYIAR